MHCIVWLHDVILFGFGNVFFLIFVFLIIILMIFFYKDFTIYYYDNNYWVYNYHVVFVVWRQSALVSVLLYFLKQYSVSVH